MELGGGTRLGFCARFRADSRIGGEDRRDVARGSAMRALLNSMVRREQRRCARLVGAAMTITLARSRSRRRFFRSGTRPVWRGIVDALHRERRRRRHGRDAASSGDRPGAHDRLVRRSVLFRRDRFRRRRASPSRWSQTLPARFWRLASIDLIRSALADARWRRRAAFSSDVFRPLQAQRSRQRSLHDDLHRLSPLVARSTQHSAARPHRKTNIALPASTRARVGRSRGGLTTQRFTRSSTPLAILSR